MYQQKHAIDDGLPNSRHQALKQLMLKSGAAESQESKRKREAESRIVASLRRWLALQ